MTFKDAVVTVFKDKMFKIEGRASRSEYWWSFLFYIVAVIVLAIFAGMLGAVGKIGAVVGGIILFIAVIWMVIGSFCVFFRRCHDIGFSTKQGFLYFLAPSIIVNVISGFIPVVSVLGLVILGAIVYFFTKRGTVGPNQFGPDPLDPNAIATEQPSNNGGFNPFQNFNKDDLFNKFSSKAPEQVQEQKPADYLPSSDPKDK